MVSSRRLLPVLLSASALFWTLPAMAQSAAPAAVSADLWSRSNLLGDMGGLRGILGKYGGTLSISDSENLLGNLAGGVKAGRNNAGRDDRDPGDRLPERRLASKAEPFM